MYLPTHIIIIPRPDMMCGPIAIYMEKSNIQHDNALRNIVVLGSPWPLTLQLTEEVGYRKEAIIRSSDSITVTLVSVSVVALMRVAMVVRYVELDAFCPGRWIDEDSNTLPPGPI